jgi:RNA polymerase sigma-70 factor (ECF subfamily)
VTEHAHELHNHLEAARAVTDPPGPIRRSGERSELDDFLAVVERYERRITGLVARFLDDPRDIEESVQDTFVQAWRHRGEFRNEAAVFTWLYRIATNTALMRLRRRRHTTVPIDEIGPGAAAALADDPLAHHPDLLTVISDVRGALADLPEHHRLAVILRDVEGLSNAEAAHLLGLPITTVKGHLHRGRAALRRHLHPR